MKAWMFLLVVVVTLCVSTTLAKIESEIDLVEDQEKYIKMNLFGEEDPEDYEEEAEESYDDEEFGVYNPPDEDDEQEEAAAAREPCNEIFCGAGRQCVVKSDGEGLCLCVSACEDEVDPRRRVCSNLNETWMSDCEMYRQRCLCEDGEPTCRKEDYGHMHIDYYGECQQLQECQQSELDDFPRRMNEWLFNIMRDMADRKILSEHYLQLEQEAEQDSSKQWTNAVVWKWCDLDSHPRDRTVSRHELFPIRAPLLALEHCIGEFLDSCDPNNDHNISLKEWATCTKLSVDDINKLEDYCEDIRDE